MTTEHGITPTQELLNNLWLGGHVGDPGPLFHSRRVTVSLVINPFSTIPALPDCVGDGKHHFCHVLPAVEVDFCDLEWSVEKTPVEREELHLKTEIDEDSGEEVPVGVLTEYSVREEVGRFLDGAKDLLERPRKGHQLELLQPKELIVQKDDGTFERWTLTERYTTLQTGVEWVEVPAWVRQEMADCRENPMIGFLDRLSAFCAIEQAGYRAEQAALEVGSRHTKEHVEQQCTRCSHLRAPATGG